MRSSSSCSRHFTNKGLTTAGHPSLFQRLLHSVVFYGLRVIAPCLVFERSLPLLGFAASGVGLSGEFGGPTPPPNAFVDRAARAEYVLELSKWAQTGLKKAFGEHTRDSLEQARAAFKCAKEAYLNLLSTTSALEHCFAVAKRELFFAEQAQEVYLRMFCQCDSQWGRPRPRQGG